jgi:hypothetical protein
MARTAQGRQLTSQHRAQQLAVRARSLRQLLDLWPVVDPADLTDTIDVFTQAAVLIALNGYDESSAASSRYYTLFRLAEGIVGGGAPRNVLAVRPARAALAGDLRGAALKGIIDGRKAGMSIAGAKDNGLVRVAGAMVKSVLAGGRMTIIEGVRADPVALGWQRVTSGDPCAFCRMLAARGATYKTEKAADFKPHDGCACTPEPLYPGDGPGDQSLAFKAEYATAQQWARTNVTRKSATSNNELNNYRLWLANGRPEPGQNAREGGTEDSGE